MVLVKQVPDMDEVEFDSDAGRIDRSSAGVEINPFDLNALEAAIKIKEDIGGTITAISMGPPQAKSALQEAIMRGVDRGILLSDKAFAGSDTLATSFALYSAIKQLDEYDFIFSGEKTVDGDTGQVGPEVAEKLGIPHVAYVSEIADYNPDELTVVNKLGSNRYTVKLDSPGLITVTKDINDPRYLSLTKRRRAKNLEVETWGFEDIQDGADEDDFGLNGSPTQVHKIVVPSSGTRKGEIFEDDPEEAVSKLLDRLSEEVEI